MSGRVNFSGGGPMSNRTFVILLALAIGVAVLLWALLPPEQGPLMNTLDQWRESR